MLGETASAADKEELRRSLGLDQPVMIRYVGFLDQRLAAATLAVHFMSNASVTELIRARLPATLELTLSAMRWPS